jgi:hypothetical protein
MEGNSWHTQRAIPAFFWKDYEQRQTTTSIAHIPSKIRLKQLFECIYRLVKSGELEGYKLTSRGRNSSVDIVTRARDRTTEGSRFDSLRGQVIIPFCKAFRAPWVPPVPSSSGTMDRFIACKSAPGIKLTSHIVYC